MYRGVWYTGAINEEEGSDMPMEDMLEMLKSCCRRGLERLYPAGVPPAAMWRYRHELELVERAGTAEEYLLFREISKAAERTFSKIYVPNSVQGTMLVYLLGDHDLNPLSAHYYCTACGYYTEPKGAVVGLDLPPADCPHCGKPLRRDGFSLRRQWSDSAVEMGAFSYWFSNGFYPTGCRVIEQHYRKRGRCAVPSACWRDSADRYESHGMVVLPRGKTMDTMPEALKIRDEFGVLCIDVTDLDKVPIPLSLRRTELLDRMEALQRESGISLSELPVILPTRTLLQDMLATDIPDKEQRTLLRRQKPATIGAIMDCLTACCNLYERPDGDNIRHDSLYEKLQWDEQFARSFAEYPVYSREGLYDLLRRAGCDREGAFEMSESIRRGRWCFDPEQRAQCLPQKLLWQCAHIVYLSGRAPGCWWELQYLRMAQYLHLVPQTFYRVMWGV